MSDELRATDAAEFRAMASINGRIDSVDRAAVPVMDRGFLYGDSIYEVFRTYEGVPLLYDEHWARFENSARLIHMDIGFSKEQVGDEIRRTVQATGAPALGRDVYVRYVVTRGSGPVDLYPAEHLGRRLVVIVKEAPVWDPAHYSVGLRIAVASTRRNAANALDPNIKGGNYLNNVLGVIEARRLGADDCIMLNEQGLLTEASNSNVFFVVDGRLLTPSQHAANLKGLTKQTVHAICRSQGLQSDEVEISVQLVSNASECFLTSATREIMPVRSILLENGQILDFPEGGGDLTRRIATEYREFISSYVHSHRALSLFRPQAR
jgi:branched-chain amino acid aminotransferase